MPLTVAAEEVVLIDYIGFGVEDGGIPSSDPGDILKVLAIADDIDPIFGVDLNTTEVTLYITDLVSMGALDQGTFDLIGYTGGHITVYADPSNDAAWDADPIAAAASFTNGTVLLDGNFASFTLYLNHDDSGAFEGYVDGVGGTISQACAEDCAFTFGGAFGQGVVQIPDGYNLQVDGVLEVLRAISNDQSSWGAVKALYHE